MAGDIFRRWSSGDRLNLLPAELLNQLIEMVKDYRRRKGQKAGDVILPAETEIYVKNSVPDTSYAQYSIVKLGAKAVVPDAQADVFFGNAVFEIAPPEADAPFAIIQEPCPVNGIVKARIAGWSWCKLNLLADAHDYAAPVSNVYTALTSQVTAGPARILWTDDAADPLGTTLDGAIGANDTVIHVAPNDDWPDAFTVEIDSEQIQVLSTSGTGATEWIVERGVNGTTPAAHADGASVTLQTGMVWALVAMDNVQSYEPAYLKVAAYGSWHDDVHQYHYGQLWGLDSDGLPEIDESSDVAMDFFSPLGETYYVRNKTYAAFKVARKWHLYAVSKINNNTGNWLTDTDSWLRAYAFASPNGEDFEWANAPTAWDNVSTFNKGQFVIHNEVKYIALITHTGQQPPNATYWLPLTTDEGIYSNSATYQKGQYVLRVLDSYRIADNYTTQTGLRISTIVPNSVPGYVPPVSGLAASSLDAVPGIQIYARNLNAAQTATLDLTPLAVSSSAAACVLNNNGASPSFGVSTHVGAWSDVGGLSFKGGLYISGSMTGASTITTVGTVTTGVWNATVIGAAYGGLGLNSSGWTAGSYPEANGSGGFTQKKNNYAGVGAPTVNDDSGDGYSVGSEWYG